MAATAQQQHKPEQLLQAALLRQLENYQEFLDLDPSALWEELRALQLAALYGGEVDVESGVLGVNSKKGKAWDPSMHDQVEEFLI